MGLSCDFNVIKIVDFCLNVLISNSMQLLS